MNRVAALAAICVLLAPNASAEPATWQISTGSATEVWLLGSIHYLRERDHPLPDVIDALYARADTLVMEIDLDDLDPVAVQARFMQAAMLPPTRPLSSVLDADIYAAAATTARDVGLELTLLEPFEPWLVALTLMDLGMARIGLRAEQGLEQHLLRRALADGKPVHGLETLAEQIGVFDDMTMAEQQALLAQTLEDLESSEREMDELIAAWRDGRLAPLAGKLAESFTRFPRLYDTLVVERNRRWVDELVRLAAQPGRYLVIVGALHLVGERNVVELLEARGIEVVEHAPK